MYVLAVKPAEDRVLLPRRRLQYVLSIFDALLLASVLPIRVYLKRSLQGGVLPDQRELRCGVQMWENFRDAFKGYGVFYSFHRCFAVLDWGGTEPDLLGKARLGCLPEECATYRAYRS